MTAKTNAQVVLKKSKGGICGFVAAMPSIPQTTESTAKSEPSFKEQVRQVTDAAGTTTEILSVLTDLGDKPNWEVAFAAMVKATEFEGLEPKEAMRKAVRKAIRKNFTLAEFENRQSGRTVATMEKISESTQRLGLATRKPVLVILAALVGDNFTDRDLTLAWVLSEPSHMALARLSQKYPQLVTETTGDLSKDFVVMQGLMNTAVSAEELRDAIFGQPMAERPTPVQATAPVPETSAVPPVVQAAAPVEAQVAPAKPETRPTPVPLDIPATEVVEESQEALAVSAVGVASTRLHADPTVGVVNGNLLTELGEKLYREHHAAGKAVSVEAFASELIGRYRQHMAAEVEKLLTSNKRQRRG